MEQAKTALGATQARIPLLEAQLRREKNALSILLGRPPSHLTELLDPFCAMPVPPPDVAVGIPADLLRRRPDIRSAEMTAAAQCARIGVSKASLYPSFSLSGTLAFQTDDAGNNTLADMFQWSSRRTSLGPSFQWNILNYGQITNQVRVEDARFQEALISYQSAVLIAQREVEDALIDFLRTQDQAGFLAESADAAMRSADLAVLQYQEGITDFTTVIIAQQALLNQQDTLAQSLGNISINLVRVYRALGGGWQIRRDHDFLPESIKRNMADRTNWGKLLETVTYEPPDGQSAHEPIIPLPHW